MGFRIENIMDLIMAGGGVSREKGDNSGTGKVSVAAVAEIEQTSDVGGTEVGMTSFFLRGGLEGMCSYSGKCRAGVEASFIGVPGILGTFAAVNAGADYGFSDHDTKVFVGGEFGFLNIFSPAAEIWSLEGRVTMDTSDRSIGVGLFLNVGGSIKTAVSHH